MTGGDDRSAGNPCDYRRPARRKRGNMTELVLYGFAGFRSAAVEAALVLGSTL